MLAILISGYFFYLCVHGCTVHAGGTSYNLAPLQNRLYSVEAPSDEESQWLYTSSFCSDDTSCENIQGSFCKWMRLAGGKRCQTVYGQWASGKSEKTATGFQTTFEGPSDCQNDKKYSSIFNYVCDAKMTNASLLHMTAEKTGDDDCEYTVTIPTSIACGGSAAGGLSAGSILLITLLCVICVYLIAMMSLSYHREKTIQIPHKSFWCGKCPYWTKTGCLVTFAASVTCYKWCCKKIFKANKEDDSMADALVNDGEESA